MAPPREAFAFPSSKATFIDPYLPTTNSAVTPSTRKPFVTLTYATSLDSSISLSPGVQTVLSGPESKAMTHYLRSKHDAILIGCRTAIADDPSLNCRIEGVGGYGGETLQGQPRPVVLDPKLRWDAKRSKVVGLAKEGRGKAPWLLVLEDLHPSNREYIDALERVGGKFIAVTSTTDGQMDWKDILSVLAHEGITSVMIEGGGTVITDLLSPRWLQLVDSVIVTIAPTWLGKESVTVVPDERRSESGDKIPVGRLKEVHWVPLGEDVVLCGRPNAM